MGPFPSGWRAPAALLVVTLLGYPTTARSADPTLLAWGQNVYQKINNSLQVPGSSLYAEAASLDGSRFSGDSGFAWVWPTATQFRVLNSLVRLDSATYRPVLRSFADELQTRYWRKGTGGAGGYRCGVSTGSERYYDDNGHLVVSLAEAYRLTGEARYLDRAIGAYDFVISGEDSAGGGGIYWSVGDHTSKDAISTLQAVRGGLLLHQITGQSRYLDDATRLYAWAATHIQEPNGLFRERFELTGPNAGTSGGNTLVNSAGIGISCNVLFYDTTGDTAYLSEAQRIGHTSCTGYFNAAGAINDEGFWAFELVDALDDLYLRDYDPAWLAAVTGAMSWLHTNREDPNGHYGRLWARDSYTPGTVRPSWELNDQAAVARSYLHTAATVDTTPPDAVTNLTPTVACDGITLSWTNPTDADFAGARIVFRTTGYPLGPTDGTCLANQAAAPGSRDQFVHTGLGCNILYYYAVFAYDRALNYAAAPAATAARIQCGDFDLDNDVDQEDFGFFQRCLSALGTWTDLGCAPADLNADGHVDLNDFRLFEACMAGPGHQPGC